MRFLFLLPLGFMVGSASAQINCPPNLPLTLVGNTDYCIGSSGAELIVEETYDLYEWLPTALTGQTAELTQGTYQLVVTHYTGCTDTLDIEVEQVSNPPQPVVTASGPTQFCAGGSVLLSGPEGYPYYEWNTGSVSDEITIYESGTFVLSVVDWIGCSSSSSSIQVIVDPLPVAIFSPSLNLFEIEFENLSVDATNYEWNFGDGNTSVDFEPTYTYNTEGLHEMYLVASNNCGTDTAFYNLASVNIEEQSFNDVSFYPNPSNGICFLKLTSLTDQSIEIAVTDVMGKVVASQRETLSQGNVRLNFDFSTLDKGLYFVRIGSENGTHAESVLIY